VGRISAARSAGLSDLKRDDGRSGRQESKKRRRNSRQLRLERLRDTLVAQIDVEVVVAPLLVTMVGETAVVAAMNGRRRLLAVEAQMHVRMRVRNAREEERECGELSC
jgi:hypothetical protein